jgi:hypothetical protein
VWHFVLNASTEIILYQGCSDGASYERGGAAERNLDHIGATPTNNKASTLAPDSGNNSHPGSSLRLAPNGSEPRLPVSRQAGRAVVMVQLDETGRNHVVAPGVEVEEAGVTAVAEALFVVPSRI